MSRVRRLLIRVAESDNTFQRITLQGRQYWVGRCIHCQTKVNVPLAEDEPASATVEHIVPKHHGGTDDLANLAIACARCNQGKGTRLDHRRADDPTLQRVIATLQARRSERARE